MSELKLLTVEEIAELWQCSRLYARDVLTKRPDFPKPARGSTPRRPRWLLDDVRAFASSRQPEHA